MDFRELITNEELTTLEKLEEYKEEKRKFKIKNIIMLLDQVPELNKCNKYFKDNYSELNEKNINELLDKYNMTSEEIQLLKELQEQYINLYSIANKNQEKLNYDVLSALGVCNSSGYESKEIFEIIKKITKDNNAESIKIIMDNFYELEDEYFMYEDFLTKKDRFIWLLQNVPNINKCRSYYDNQYEFNDIFKEKICDKDAIEEIITKYNISPEETEVLQRLKKEYEQLFKYSCDNHYTLVDAATDLLMFEHEKICDAVCELLKTVEEDDYEIFDDIWEKYGNF